MKAWLLVLLFVYMTGFGVYSSQNIGDVCQDNYGVAGICNLSSKCAIKGGRKKICSYGGVDGKRIVCCINPPATNLATEEPTERPTQPPVTDISKLKCKEYTRYGYDILKYNVNGREHERKEMRCTHITQMIVGGLKANPKEYPHMAILGLGEFNNITWFCGGSLISERFILTAAHCLRTGVNAVKWVRLGDLNLVREDDDARPETIGVEKSIKHPKYSPASHYNDIGLVKLERDVAFSAYIRPACLHTLTSVRPDTDVIASGWGRNESNSQLGTEDLMMVRLKIVSYKTCNNLYKYLKTLSNKLNNGITVDLICAGDTNKDTCQGDSGGPLQVKLPGCMYSILGVTSFGLPGCGIGNSSGVYTKVSAFIPWIEQKVWLQTT